LKFKGLINTAQRMGAKAVAGVCAFMRSPRPIRHEMQQLILPLAALAFALAFIPTLQAQQRPPDSGSILEQTKQPAPPPKVAPDVLPRAPEPRPALGAPGLKLVVNGFRVSGNTIYPEDVLLAEVKEFIGKEQTIDGLNDAATKVRAYYRERGYFLVQAYLPQQEIKGGVVEIAVIEARIGKVALNLKEGTRYSESLVRGIVEKHLVEGSIITETSLETPLLLLNDLPNATVTSEIKPSQTIGAADLVISVSDSPGLISGSVDIDNHGNRFTGAWRGGVSLNLSNPFALGDQFSFRAFTTDEEMSFYRLAYVVPVGYWGTRIGASYSTFHYQLGKDFAATQSHGVGAVNTIYGFHPFIRTRGSNLILQVAYETKKLNDRVDTTQTNVDRIIDATKIGLVGDFRDGMLGGGLNSYSFTITEGNAKINQATVLAADVASGLNSAGRFNKKNFEFRRLQKITDNSNLLLSLQGQMASKNLMSAEKFSLGGPSGVRSYPTGEALGDTGYIFQAEYRYIVPGVRVADGDLSLSGFYDQGWVQINENALRPTGNPAVDNNNRTLTGYGVGASLGRDSDFVLRMMAAWRLENEAPQSDTSQRIPRVWVQAIKWF
jgi:hemolysin activation/secretion protein